MFISTDDRKTGALWSRSSAPPTGPLSPSELCERQLPPGRVRRWFGYRAGGRGGAGRRDTNDHDMTAIKDIIDSIENRLRELNEEIGDRHGRG
jgi:hypothetical protein